jgi:hypothetical protein
VEISHVPGVRPFPDPVGAELFNDLVENHISSSARPKSFPKKNLMRTRLLAGGEIFITPNSVQGALQE